MRFDPNSFCALLLSPLLTACTTNATPDVREGTSFGLGPDGFAEVRVEDAVEEAQDAPDVLETIDSEETTASLGGACSVLRGDCEEGLKCGIDHRGRGVCVSPGDRQRGDLCGEEGVDDCAEGLLCYDADGSGLVCVAVCDAETGAGCEVECGEPLRWTAEPVGLCPEA